MTSFNPFSLPILFFSILSLSFLSLTTNAADPVYLTDVCANNTFSANSIYQSNLKSLLSSLDSNATRNIEFFNTTTGQNTSDPVYGLFNCRGDVTPQLCRDCVNAVVKVLTSKCSREKVALTYYDECIVCYSNRSFFSTVDEKPRLGLLNTQNVTDQDKFNRLLNTSMLQLVTETSDAPTGSKKFETKQVSISAFQTLYNLAQCTPDLSSTDCKTCLQDAVMLLPWCCSGKQGGRIVFPSCNISHCAYTFTWVQSPPPPSPSSVSGPKEKSKLSTSKIVAIVVPISASVVLFIVGCCFLIRRGKKYNAVDGENDKSKLSTSKIVAIVAPISASVVLFIVGCCFLIRRGKKYNAIDGENAANDITTVESLQFDFVTIESATNKFSEDNKLGEGGFGQVYKGTLPNGQEIAVKRLSKSSGQGAEQFKNEVVVVAQLQHRNLARLLGFCLQGEEKILVYEFVPNKDLDYILYNPKKQGLLDLSRRYKIIGGIARGIQYLHEDSRLRIIHRDLKASNVLLDADMNPKISDFGMARIFGVDQTQGNTSRIVGTYGYMSLEYAMHGKFSMKSDVYSFGVLVLEIITGKKNSNFYESEVAEDLLSYVWIHWRDGRPLELLDPALGDSFSRDEVMRCIHIGLLCVQEDPADRPTMATIVLTLTSGSVSLQAPQQPALFSKTDTNIPRKGLESDQSTSKSMPWSVNEASVTELDPR